MWNWKCIMRSRVLVALALIVSVGVSGTALARTSSARHLASNCVTCLGAPMDIVSTEAYFPLSGFHRIPTFLHQGSKPELLFLGVEDSELSDIERWPVVKALDQFGSFSQVTPAKRFCGNASCSIASFDLSHAEYRSRYIAFVSRDLVDAANGLYQRPSREELALFNRYARPPKAGSYRDAVLAAANTYAKSSLPLVTVGGYLQTETQIMNTGDFQALVQSTSTTGSAPDLPFAAVQQSLQESKPVDSAYPSLVRDVNAEANIITALICHANGKRPASVCGRSSIKSILKHVK